MEQNSSFSRYLVRHVYLTRAVVLGALTLSIILMGTLPLINSTREMSAKIRTTRKEASDLADKVTILSGIDQNVLDERVTALDNALPPRKDVILYLTTVQGLSRELNLNFGGISLAPGNVTDDPKANQGLHTLDTDLKIAGSKDNIYSFLRLIEQSAPLMQIKDVKVTQTNEGENFSLGLKLGMLWAASDPSTVKGQIALFDEKEEQYFQQLSQFRRFVPVTDGSEALPGSDKIDLFGFNETQQ